MRDKLKIFLAKARLDDKAAVESLVQPIRTYGNLAEMFKGHRSGFSYAYEEESSVGRFIASNGVTVMSFSITGVTRQEAASIAQECEQIAVWDMYEIRKATDRALDSATNAQ